MEVLFEEPGLSVFQVVMKGRVQGGQLLPPQSTPVSSPFWMPSEQVTGRLILEDRKDRSELKVRLAVDSGAPEDQPIINKSRKGEKNRLRCPFFMRV
jgi:hypothetical protein